MSQSDQSKIGDEAPSPDDQVVKPRSATLRSLPFWLLKLLVVYFVLAYLFIPLLWKGYMTRHPALDSTPRITRTGDGHPGDPINVSLVGSEAEVKAIMSAAKWYSADPLGLRSDIRIAADTVLRRAYDDAPVSSLYLFGRKEDLAFEQPVGKEPSKRHHVRFWKNGEPDNDGRPLWLGSATYDERVGLSHTTGQITHHISADVDAERDHIGKSLDATGLLERSVMIPNYHSELSGRNGGGDKWHTDGSLYLGEIKTDSLNSE